MNQSAENIESKAAIPAEQVENRQTQLNRDREVAALGFSTTQPELLQASRCLDCAYAAVPNFSRLSAEAKASVVSAFMTLEEEEGITIAEFDVEELVAEADYILSAQENFEEEEKQLSVQEQELEAKGEYLEVKQEKLEVEAEQLSKKDIRDKITAAANATEATGLALFNELESQFAQQKEILNQLSIYRQKLESISTSGATEAENAVLAQVVAQTDLNFSGGSDQEVFASMLPLLDAAQESGSLSQETANRVRVSIGAPPKNNPEPLKVASNSKKFGQDLMDRRIGFEEVRDPETGEVIDYKEVENNDVIEINNAGLKAYLQPIPGTEKYKVTIPLRSQLPREHVVDADRIMTDGLTELNAFFALQAGSEAGFPDLFGSEYTDSNTIKQNYDRFIMAAGLDPFDGSMWTSEASDRLIYIMQMIHPRGDWGQGDVDKKNWKEYGAEKGIYNLDTDQWNYDALRTWRDSAIFATVGKDGEALDRSGNNPTAPDENETMER